MSTTKTLSLDVDYLLLTPGPTPVPETVRAATAKPLLHHRTPEFAKILDSIYENLKPVFQTKEAEIHIICGSGTAAMETAVVNFFSPGEKVIVTSIGQFGDRWATIAKSYGLDVVVLAEEWGNPVNLERLKKTLDSDPKIAGVFATHLDTSTATVNPIKEIGALTKNRDTILLVDSISGLAGEEMRQDEWGADVVVSASQKGLMCPPGIAYISVMPKAGKRIDGAKIPRFYFDLRIYRKSKADGEMPFTAPISLLVGQAEALKEINREGVEVRLRRYQELARWTREAVANRLGCKLFSKSPSIVLSSGFLPSGLKEGTTSTAILKYLRDEHRITIADGQGALKGKVFRIAHMGAIGKADVTRGIEALEQGFKKFS